MEKIKKIPVKLIIAVIIGASLFLPPFIKYQQMRYKSKDLERQIRELKEEAKRLEEDKNRLETDITYVERRAREKMGVAKKGEIILKETPVRK